MSTASGLVSVFKRRDLIRKRFTRKEYDRLRQSWKNLREKAYQHSLKVKMVWHPKKNIVTLHFLSADHAWRRSVTVTLNCFFDIKIDLFEELLYLVIRDVKATKQKFVFDILNRNIAVEEIMEKISCAGWTRQRIEKHVGDGKTLIQILKNQTDGYENLSYMDRIYCAFEFLPYHMKKRFAADCIFLSPEMLFKQPSIIINAIATLDQELLDRIKHEYTLPAVIAALIDEQFFNVYLFTVRSIRLTGGNTDRFSELFLKHMIETIESQERKQ